MIPTESPVRAAEDAIRADQVHADSALWITRRDDEAIRADAAALEREGPGGRRLWGVPFAVKDNLDVAGLPTTAACPAFAYVAEATAPTVQRLLDEGALLLGKTNLDQFATGLSGVRSPYGTPRNVFAPAHVPGGSSSGSACAVAAGIARFALGTDTAGSGRVPAMFGNIVGLKPTMGALSTRGLVPACRSLDCVSVFAASVDEALAVAEIAAGYDGADPYSRAAPAGYLRRGGLAGHERIAVPESLPPSEGAAAFARAAGLFATVRFDLSPFLEIARLLYEGPWVAERTAALRAFLEQHADALHPATATILQAGLARSAVDAFAAFHRLAECRRIAQDLFARVDAMLLPTAPFCPTLAACAADPIGPNARLGTFTNFVNLCDLAAIAVPAGFGPSGLPEGVTVIGPAWSEGRLAAIADRIHRESVGTVGSTGSALPRPRPPAALRAGETALFCVGGHMSGLPLNGQLRERGGRMLREARTAPTYRLYALGDRPGMVRATGGAAIAGEVWALPTAEIGPLLALVPAPLGFGTVQLEDGPCLGFLAEAEAVAGAADITAAGGWRAHLSTRTGALADAD